MKILVVEGPNVISMKNIEVPDLKKDEILVNVAYTGICGTDLAIYRGETNLIKDGLIKYPVRIGHEWSGVVEKTGPDVKNFKHGDSVVADNGVTCGKCEFCLAGEYNSCPDVRCVGTINCWDGSYAEFIVMPERHVHHLPNMISLKAATLIEPMSVALSSLRSKKIDHNSNLVVIGTGPIGLAAVAIAKSIGAGRIFCVGRTDSKLEVAVEAGADITINTLTENVVDRVMEATEKKGSDFVIETSGAIETIHQSVEMAAHKATIALVGFYENNINEFDIDKITMKNLTIKGILTEFGSVQETIEIIRDTGLNLEYMITEVIDFEDAVGYFENAHNTSKKRIKTLVRIKKEIDK